MSILSYGAHRIATTTDETVLHALSRQGITVRSSCRGGTCQTCVMRCTEGEIPARAQSGLNADLVAKHYFLPCVCKPTHDMTLAEPVADDFFVTALVEQRLADAQGLTFLLEPLRTLPVASTAVMVRDAQGRKARFAISNKPAEDYYFAIQLSSTDQSALATHWRDSLYAGMQIEMREALADESNAPDDAAPETIDAQRPKDPPPDLELWAALGEGVLLRTILEDFYTKVYADTQLAPFFVGFTRQRLIEKQHSFMQQVMTGNKVYFGNRPRNTHHWMVISDALFEHREQLMQDSMRANGLAEKWVQRWLAIENHYRPDIVKSAPIQREFDGIALPLEGYDDMVLDVGAMCDGCGGVIDPGETVRYHLRMGTIFCPSCRATQATE